MNYNNRCRGKISSPSGILDMSNEVHVFFHNLVRTASYIRAVGEAGCPMKTIPSMNSAHPSRRWNPKMAPFIFDTIGHEDLALLWTNG